MATTAALTTVENKIPNFSNLVKKVTTTQKVMELKGKLLIMVIVISILLLRNVTAENFAVRLKPAKLASKSDIANFVNKTDFDNKLLSFNNRINSSKTKHVLIENELNELSKKVKLLSTKDYRFLQAIMDYKLCLFINQQIT